MSSRRWPTGWERLALALLLVLAGALRVAVVVQYEAEHPQADAPVIDEASYDAWGARVAEGDWLGSEVFFQEPLYPYTLGAIYALFGHDLTAARLVQCGLGVLAVLLIFLLARELFGRVAAWTAGLGLAFYGPALLLPSYLLKPNLFLPLLLGFAWLLVRRGGGRRWLLLGLLGGLGALLRGNMLLLLPAFALWALFEVRGRAGVARSASFVLGVALVLGPVLVRNRVVGGIFALTTSGAGTNVYGGNNAENPHGVATEFSWVRGVPAYEAEDWRQEAQRRTGRALDAGEVSRYWLGETWRSMKRDPLLHASILWNKLRLSLGAYEVPDNHLYTWDRRYVPLMRLPWPGFGLWGALGLAGLLSWWITREPTVEGARPGALALVFMAYLATIVMTVTSARARLPLVVLSLPFAGAWVVHVVTFARGRHGSSRLREGGLVSLTLIAGWLVVHAPVLDRMELDDDLRERDYNLAVQYVERGELAAARTLSEELLEAYPASCRLAILGADLDWRAGTHARAAGREEEGRALVSRALETLHEVTLRAALAPRERSRAYRLAGYIQADLGNAGAAARFLGRAREFAPRDPELWLAHLVARTQACADDAECLAEVRVELEKLARLGAPESAAARALARSLEDGLPADLRAPGSPPPPSGD